MSKGMSETKINQPSWTEYRLKNGLDPLGMQNSGVSLYQTFLPGISNVTLRIRYYGLYAWLCRTYLQRNGDTNPESWKRVVRRAEALYALIAQKRGGETGVAGIEWAQEQIALTPEGEINFAAAAEPGSEEYYLKQTWGVFGLAYRSQLFAIGVFTRGDGEHELPLPSAERGEALADGFAHALGDHADLFYEIVDRGSVTHGELDLLRDAAPSEITSESSERKLYQDLLLAANDRPESSGFGRRQSILLVLAVAQLLGRTPKPDEVRWVLYAGFDQEGRALELSTQEQENQRARWWTYQASDLCHIALETLLKFVLDRLSLHPSGLRLPNLLSECVQEILGAADASHACWDDFLKAVVPAPNAYDGGVPTSEWKLTQDIMRSVGKVETSQIAGDTAWKAIQLLAILQKRSAESGRNVADVLGVFDPELFRSLHSETLFLQRHGQEPFADLLSRLLEERVIRRHLWVALRKFRYQKDYTFLIESDEGRLRCKDKDGPVFTNPRLGPTITFLKDLHIIGGLGVTDYGAELLRSA